MLDLLPLMIRSLIAALGSRRNLALENLVLRHQLVVALRTNPHPQLRVRDRVLWVWLRHLWPEGWRQHLWLVRPETVLRWHRRGWRLYWTWKSRTKLGRPHLSAEVRALIARIAQENPLWGTERIRGELLKLGLVVSNRSVRRYRRRRFPPGDHQRWRSFLANQLRGIWAADLFVVQTVSYHILYVFFLIRHERREWIHFNVTASPAAAWIWRQLIAATPLSRQPKFLIHDRDADYGSDFDERLATLGITGVRTPARAPRANAIGERIVRTIRAECLDHLIVVNEDHLVTVLAEFADYYNRDRPHRSLRLESPISTTPQAIGRVVSRSVLGGLHHAYARAA